MTDKYLCNLIIPGAGKSGTSTLHMLLDQHPEICMARPKEPQFFSFDKNYNEGASRHNRLFQEDSAIKYYGESSQSYFTHTHAIQRIKTQLSHPRIILILRHPVARLLSQYTWNRKRATERDPLAVAIGSRGDTTAYTFDDRIGMHREVGGYLEFSRYSKWVPVWRTTFGEENVLVVTFENMTEDQLGTLNACLDFLELRRIGEVNPVSSNTTEKTYRRVFPGFVSSAARIVPKSLKNSEIYSDFRKFVMRKTTPTPDVSMDHDLKDMIENELADDIRFYKSLG